MDPSGHFFLKKLWDKFVGTVKSWFEPFINPEPTNLSWWTEVAGRAIPVFVPRALVQQAQQGLQQANAFLVEKAGFSPAAASAVIGGILAIPTGGWGIALAAGGAYLSTEALETQTAERIISGVAEGLIDLGVSEAAAYEVASQLVGLGVGTAIGFGLAGASEAAAVGLSRLSSAANRVTIYRGVGRGHPGYEDATRGVVKPWGGRSNPSLHNAGDTRSEFTSWTTKKAVAKQFAEGDGIILQMTVDRSKLIRSPDWYNEGEVLIQGSVSGAKVRYIDDR